MPKSNSRRKQDRTKRQNAAASRQRANQRRRAEAAEQAEFERRWALVTDPSVPADVAATALRELYDSEPVTAGLAMILVKDHGSASTVAEIAAAVQAQELEEHGFLTMTGMTFGAHAAHLAGDHARSRALMDDALRAAREQDRSLEFVHHLNAVGRVADSLDIMATEVASPEYDDATALSHESALVEAHQRSRTLAASADCPCGSGAPWSACCAPREAAALSAFADRSGIYALRDAVNEFQERSPYGDAVASRVSEWLTATSIDSLDTADAEREALTRLAIENAWLTAGIDADSESDEDTVLAALAADPLTDPAIAAEALTWRDHIRYGLWQVADPTSAPGVWCIDIVTGQERYVAVAPEQVELLPRWGVMVGAIVPLDGAWRSTGTLLSVSPTEADALCETIRANVEVVVGDLAGRPSRKSAELARRPVPFRNAPPHNVYAYDLDVSEFVPLIGRIVGALLPRLLRELREYHSAPPGVTNTDGDPMVMIKARVRVSDASRLVTALAANRDFHDDPHEPGAWTWLGKTMPAEQTRTMLAELRAQGHDVDPSDEPQRWVRGQIRVSGDELAIEVNSRQRFDRLLEIIAATGAEPSVVDESRIDPVQDMAWTGPALTRGGFAAPEQGWESQWIDERVPALRGRTPRQASASPHDRALLESLLRQFEYDGDLAARGGGRGIDTAWLREQLNMPVDL